MYIIIIIMLLIRGNSITAWMRRRCSLWLEPDWRGCCGGFAGAPGKMNGVWALTPASLQPCSPPYPWKSPLTEALFVLFTFALCQKGNEWWNEGRLCVRALRKTGALISAPRSWTQSHRHAQEHVQQQSKSAFDCCKAGQCHVPPCGYMWGRQSEPATGELRRCNRLVITCHPTIL